MERLRQLFESHFKIALEHLAELGASGSNRRYYRMSGGGISAIGVIGTSLEENRVFVQLSQHFRERGLNMPEVYAVSDDSLAYIQQDLGNTQLYEKLSRGRKSGNYSPEDVELLSRTIKQLPKIQFEGAKGLDFSICHPDDEFNARLVDFDLNYFKYCYLKAAYPEFDERRLQDDFDALKEELLACPSDAFMYRDFQARNVMLFENEPYFIDFQGGRRGPIYYDVASFIWQARSRFPKEIKEYLIDSYLEALKPYKLLDKEEFLKELRLFVLFRTLQVLGVYGFRGYFEKKAHFLASIPHALANLRELLLVPFDTFPYLNQILSALCAEDSGAKRLDGGALKVRINSFSYKKGLPEDPSGNGGGYIFDCRAIHNPGKYEEYKSLTGMDKEVIAFLEDDGEILVFLDHIYRLVDAHVERFIKRGFTDLQVSFGCTGGQHRSVYCAEHLAKHLNTKYDIAIELNHREQGIIREL